MRYVMRIAEYVNHQIFERKLRFRVLLGAFLFQCLLTLLARVVVFCTISSRRILIFIVNQYNINLSLETLIKPFQFKTIDENGGPIYKGTLILISI